MIESFADKRTAAIFQGLEVRGLPRETQATARRKLKIVDATPSLETLRVPPGNRLEPLKGDRKGQWSIRVNDQWRICFRWKDGTAFDVEITGQMSIARSALKREDFKGVTTGRKLAAVHPGAVLVADFIEPMGITRYRVAKAIGVQQRRIDEICAGTRAVTADTAVRLGLAFGVEPQFWLQLQAQYDIEVIQRDQGKKLAEDVHALAA